ncbi:3-hydroxyacyl-CoA dehydrogenase [Actinopolymorpha singaporensis]
MAVLPVSTPVGVVGAGTMGAGIAQVALVAGHEVRLYDAQDGAADRGVAQILARLDRLVEKGRLERSAVDAARGRLTAAASLADLAPSGLVIEAVVEQLPVKREVFGTLEKVCADDAILATNTSTLSVTAIAAGLRRPGRVTGMHFFNPAPLMALVEVPGGAATDPQVAQTVADTATAWGKTPVRCASTPGFVANRVARPFYGEAMQVLEEGGADCATIDAVLTEAAGFPMGPFTLADLVGNDVNLAVGRSVWEQTFGDPRYAPFVAQQQVVDAGWLGRKTGRGWYEYGGDAGSSGPPRPRTAQPRTPPDQVTYHGGFTACFGLLDRIAAAGVSMERYDTGPAAQRSGPGEFEPGESAYGIELPGGGLVLETTGEPATFDGDAVTLDWVGDAATATRVCLAPGDACEPGTLDHAIGLFQAAGLAVSVIDDVPGLIVARTVCMLVNEAVDLVGRREASAPDVDVAMRLGTGYPRGPLAWGDQVGPEVVADVLGTLARAYPGGRYRPSPLLVRAARTGRSLRSL